MAITSSLNPVMTAVPVPPQMDLTRTWVTPSDQAQLFWLWAR